MDFTIEQIFLFGLYTLITMGAAIVNRLYVNNKGEAVKNESVGAMNKIAKEALVDVRGATTNLIVEIEKRASLEGQVTQLSALAESERKKGETSAIEQALLKKQLTSLSGEMQTMRDDMNKLQMRLTEVGKEKKLLVEEKATLQAEIDEQGTAYQALLKSIQERIDKAVSDVREELRKHYEEKLSLLEQKIRDKDAEIEQLKTKLQEDTHETNQIISDTQPADDTLLSTDSDSGGG